MPTNINNWAKFSYKSQDIIFYEKITEHQLSLIAVYLKGHAFKRDLNLLKHTSPAHWYIYWSIQI